MPPFRPLLSVLAPALLATALAPAAAAQTAPVLFQSDPPASTWTWSAAANGFPITPTAGNPFEMHGTFTVDLDFNAAGYASAGQMVGGALAVVPDLEGSASFLATVKVEGLVLTPTSEPLDFGDPSTSTGAFTTDVVWTVLEGTAIITPLFGSPSVVDLVGAPTSPAQVTGTISSNPDGTQHFVSPQSMQLVLDDPGTGIQFVVDIDGTLVGDELRLVEPYCAGDGSGTPCPCGNTGGPGEGCANGTGAGAVLSASGSTSVAAADLVLSGSGLTEGPGLYFQGDEALNGGLGAPFGDGLRCAGVGVVRLEVRVADAGGATSTTVPIAATGGVQPGDTKRYQLWYRDPATSPCGSTFNLSGALEVHWLP